MSCVFPTANTFSWDVRPGRTGARLDPGQFFGEHAVQHRILIAVVTFMTLFSGAAVPAHAQTDWSVVAASWKEQLRDLNVADAARRLCGLQAAPLVASSMSGTIAGLGQALGIGRKAGRAEQRSLVAGAGGPQKFCADAALMTRAKATLQSVEAHLLASGANLTLPYN